LSSFMSFLEKTIDGNLPTHEKIKLITERFGGTVQRIPIRYIHKDTVYRQYVDLLNNGVKRVRYMKYYHIHLMRL
jgi:hypothetical protein